MSGRFFTGNGTGGAAAAAAAHCTNCGECGHVTKQCLQPVTSFGVIVFRVRGGWNQAAQLLASPTSLNGLETEASNVEYLLIQRKDSLGYVDLLRGKYKLTDTDYIKTQIRGMTRTEQQRLCTLPFDTLWEELWGPPAEGVNPYRHEKEQSRQKLEALRSGAPSLKDLVASLTTPPWSTPEWGFPKGRRDPYETDFACAIRELREETGLLERDVVPIRNLQPIKETFFGTNRIQYCHKYFLMYMPTDQPVQLDPTNELMRREIGDIAWCSLEEALTKIRPDNVEKREVLLRASRLLRNYAPLQLRSFPIS